MFNFLLCFLFRKPKHSLTLQQWALIVINSLQIFILLLDFCLLFFTFVDVWTLLNTYLELIDTTDKNLNTLQPFYLTKNALLTFFPLLLCFHLFHLFLVYIAWYTFAHALILIASYGTCCFVYAFLCFQQNYQTLKKTLSRALKFVFRSKINKAKVTRLGYVEAALESNSAHFRLVFLFDRFIGPQLVIYLSSHMPISALFVMEILVGGYGNNRAVCQPPMTRFIKLCLVLEAFVGSLLLHLIMANFSNYIHKGGKLLMDFSARFRCERLTLGSRLIIWRHAQRLWVRRKFGITYGGKEKRTKLKGYA